MSHFAREFRLERHFDFGKDETDPEREVSSLIQLNQTRFAKVICFPACEFGLHGNSLSVHNEFSLLLWWPLKKSLLR
jgi:hypothetical protein